MGRVGGPDPVRAGRGPQRLRHAQRHVVLRRVVPQPHRPAGHGLGLHLPSAPLGLSVPAGPLGLLADVGPVGVAHPGRVLASAPTPRAGPAGGHGGHDRHLPRPVHPGLVDGDRSPPGVLPVDPPRGGLAPSPPLRRAPRGLAHGLLDRVVGLPARPRAPRFRGRGRARGLLRAPRPPRSPGRAGRGGDRGGHGRRPLPAAGPAAAGRHGVPRPPRHPRRHAAGAAVAGPVHPVRRHPGVHLHHLVEPPGVGRHGLVVAVAGDRAGRLPAPAPRPGARGAPPVRGADRWFRPAQRLADPGPRPSGGGAVRLEPQQRAAVADGQRHPAHHRRRLGPLPVPAPGGARPGGRLLRPHGGRHRHRAVGQHERVAGPSGSWCATT